MEAVAHNPAFAKKAGVPQSVGKDFSAADKGRKFQKGGATMMSKKVPEAMAAMMARRPRMGAGMPPPAMPPKPTAPMGAGMPPPAMPTVPMGMKKGGMTRKFGKGGMHKMPDGKMMKNSAMNMGGMAGMKKGGMPMKDGKPAFMMGKKMNMGGMAGYAKGGNMNAKGSMSGSSKAGENTKIQKKGLTEGKVIKMASGGSVDGIAQRGKTRGKMC